MTNKEIELQNRINHLEQVVSITNNRLKKEKYGLVWLDVPEDFEKAENKIQVLEEVKEKSIINTGAKTKHILIEGDNYHALTCLNYTHKEKVDMYEASYRVSPIPSTGCSKVRSPDSFTKQNVFDFTHLTFSRWNLISKTSFAQPSCPKQGTQ